MLNGAICLITQSLVVLGYLVFQSIQLTAVTPSKNAVRLKTGTMTFELSNRVVRAGQKSRKLLCTMARHVLVKFVYNATDCPGVHNCAKALLAVVLMQDFDFKTKTMPFVDWRTSSSSSPFSS